jgi:hypothetical protein
LLKVIEYEVLIREDIAFLYILECSSCSLMSQMSWLILLAGELDELLSLALLTREPSELLNEV